MGGVRSSRTVLFCLLSIDLLTAAVVCIALSICFLFPRTNNDLMLSNAWSEVCALFVVVVDPSW